MTHEEIIKDIYSGNAKNLRVLVIGDLGIDRYIRCAEEGISKDTLVIKSICNDEILCLGCAGNVIMNFIGLGCKPSVIGAIGSNDNGDQIKEFLSCISDRLFLVEEDSLHEYNRLEVDGHMIARFDRRKNFTLSEDNLFKIKTFIPEIIDKNKGLDAIVISDYDMGLCSEELCKFVISLASHYEIPVIVDTKSSSWEKYKGAILITPNLSEFKNAINEALRLNSKESKNIDDSLMPYYSDIMMQKFNIKYILVTKGSDGLFFKEDNDEYFITNTLPKNNATDSCGCGDTLLVGITIGLSLKRSIINSVIFGSDISQIAATKKYTHSVTFNDLIESRSFSTKIVSDQDIAKEIISHWKNECASVSYLYDTDFDQLNTINIINLVNETKRKCDFLVVVIRDLYTSQTQLYNALEDCDLLIHY